MWFVIWIAIILTMRTKENELLKCLLFYQMRFTLWSFTAKVSNKSKIIQFSIQSLSKISDNHLIKMCSNTQNGDLILQLESAIHDKSMRVRMSSKSLSTALKLNCCLTNNTIGWQNQRYSGQHANYYYFIDAWMISLLLHKFLTAFSIHHMWIQ